MRAVCATRDARLVWCVGLCLVVGFPVAAGLAELDCAVLDPEVFAAGVAVDCATPDCTTISNPNRSVKLPRPRRRTGNGEEEPDIIPLYSELLSTVAVGEPVA
jgi:hypothetical protein